MNGRILGAALFGDFWAVAIAARLFDLQIVQHDRYVEKARRQQRTVVELDPPRGAADAAGAGGRFRKVRRSGRLRLARRGDHSQSTAGATAHGSAT